MKDRITYRSDKPALLEPSDTRYKKEVKQLKNTGICDSELWSLDTSIIDFILPRLKAFLKISSKRINDDDR